MQRQIAWSSTFIIWLVAKNIFRTNVCIWCAQNRDRVCTPKLCSLSSFITGLLLFSGFVKWFNVIPSWSRSRFVFLVSDLDLWAEIHLSVLTRSHFSLKITAVLRCFSDLLLCDIPVENLVSFFWFNWVKNLQLLFLAIWRNNFIEPLLSRLLAVPFLVFWKFTSWTQKSLSVLHLWLSMQAHSLILNPVVMIKTLLLDYRAKKIL